MRAGVFLKRLPGYLFHMRRMRRSLQVVTIACTALVVLACSIPGFQAAKPAESPSPAITNTPGWTLYRDDQVGFQFYYPREAALRPGEVPVTIDLPFAANTNLVEKYLQVTAALSQAKCSSTLYSGVDPGNYASAQVNIYGMDFLREAWGGVGLGNIYETTSYSAGSGEKCASLNFVLHFTDPANYTTPPPRFDQALETGIFEGIISTFSWLK